jgi:hypothetical protein
MYEAIAGIANVEGLELKAYEEAKKERESNKAKA